MPQRNILEYLWCCCSDIDLKIFMHFEFTVSTIPRRIIVLNIEFQSLDILNIYYCTASKNSMQMLVFII